MNERFILGDAIDGKRVTAANCKVMKRDNSGYFDGISVTIADKFGVMYSGMMPVFTLKQVDSKGAEF